MECQAHKETLAGPVKKLRLSYHTGSVHKSKSERVRKISAEAIHGPVGGPEVGRVGAPDCQVLNVTPVEFGIGLQGQGDDASCQGRTG